MIVVVVVAKAVAGHSVGKAEVESVTEVVVSVTSWRLPNANSPRRSLDFASTLETRAQAKMAMERRRLWMTFIVGEQREGYRWATEVGAARRSKREKTVGRSGEFISSTYNGAASKIH